MNRLGVIILAGGRSTRMGADKAQVQVDGVRLVDRIVAGLADDIPYVVVSPYDLGIPTVSEDPPFGGPVAGIATGAAALDTELKAVLSVDAPDSPALLDSLKVALESSSSDVAVVQAADGFLQPLCALWTASGLDAALRALGDPRDKSAKKLLLAAGSRVEVAGDGREVDYDTVAELGQLGKVEL
ncbi:molybdenum cofactor guanylyltransferase [Corynebacterium cystitidis]|uniref:molybdenum cofactor guanylyltransferase n=1 Tax=Corynebacterium cystitidis TaxID=35757 RepID=UPI00211EBC5E|nr:molybdenum cofactor guanylyltransferase [Corynebacterium cystitidis]